MSITAGWSASCGRHALLDDRLVEQLHPLGRLLVGQLEVADLGEVGQRAAPQVAAANGGARVGPAHHAAASRARARAGGTRAWRGPAPGPGRPSPRAWSCRRDRPGRCRRPPRRPHRPLRAPLPSSASPAQHQLHTVFTTPPPQPAAGGRPTAAPPPAGRPSESSTASPAGGPASCTGGGQAVRALEQRQRHRRLAAHVEQRGVGGELAGQPEGAGRVVAGGVELADLQRPPRQRGEEEHVVRGPQRGDDRRAPSPAARPPPTRSRSRSAPAPARTATRSAARPARARARGRSPARRAPRRR